MFTQPPLTTPSQSEKPSQQDAEILNPILRFFAYSHLPAPLQKVSKPLGDLAFEMATTLPPSAELSAGLRKLLEANDCLVRASLPLMTKE